jgi:hypothetical protein
MTSVYVETDGLRSAAKSLTRDVVPLLNDAVKKLAEGDAVAAHGPTAGPATAAFQSAWRAELAAVVLAARHLAAALQEAADRYDKEVQQATDRLRGVEQQIRR